MQWKVSMIVLTGLSVLFVTGCGTNRSAQKSEIKSLITEVELRDTVREQVMVAVSDTMREVTTITITENEKGDTVKTSIVTNRERIRDRAAVKDKEEKMIVRTDTVFIEKRDSVFVQTTNGTDGKRGGLVSVLRWIFGIIVAIAGLVIIIKNRR